jgi:hypothetical protein
MDRLKKDLHFFEQELAKETKEENNQYRKILLLRQIRDIKQEICNLLRVERKQAERENRNLTDALNKALAMKKK